MDMARTSRRLAAAVMYFVTYGTGIAQEDPLSKDYIVAPEDVEFEAIANAPPGVLSAILLGDLNRPGVYVLRNQFPPNFRMGAHRHGEWRIMTVLEGTLYFGYGQNEEDARAYGPGSLIIEPKDRFHFFSTRDEGAVVQFIAEGPLTSSFR